MKLALPLFAIAAPFISTHAIEVPSALGTQPCIISMPESGYIYNNNIHLAHSPHALPSRSIFGSIDHDDCLFINFGLRHQGNVKVVNKYTETIHIKAIITVFENDPVKNYGNGVVNVGGMTRRKTIVEFLVPPGDTNGPTTCTLDNLKYGKLPEGLLDVEAGMKAHPVGFNIDSPNDADY